MKRRITSVMFLLCAMLVGCGRSRFIYEEQAFDLATESAAETEMELHSFSVEEPDVCYVYVCGEVNVPGVYKLPVGSRVYEAIQMAGGLTGEAQESAVNQAMPVEDGQMIQVFARGDNSANDRGTETEADDGKVNLNTADVQSLMEIPGIGEAKANSIIAYREEHGSFKAVEDVMNIAGIKEGLFSKMKDYITVK